MDDVPGMAMIAGDLLNSQARAISADVDPLPHGHHL